MRARALDLSRDLLVTFSIEGSLRPRNSTETRRPQFAKDAEKGGEQSGLRQSGKRVQHEKRSRVENRRSEDDIDYPRARGGRGDVKGWGLWPFFPSSFRKSPFDFVNPVFTRSPSPFRSPSNPQTRLMRRGIKSEGWRR